MKKNRRAQVVGIGLATPMASAVQAQAVRLAVATTMIDVKQRGLVEGLYERAGVATRGSVVLNSTRSAEAAPDQAFFPTCVRAEGSEGDEIPWPSTAARMAMFRLHAGAMAVAAARAAMNEAGISGAAITNLITVSCTGLEAPGVDIELVEGLGLGADVERLNLGFMGCHGGIVAVRTAAALVNARLAERGAGEDREEGQAGTARPPCALAVCIELCTLHFQRTSRIDQHVANALFADGAAAVVVCGPGGTCDTPGTRDMRDMRGEGNASGAKGTRGLEVTATSSHLFAESTGAMGWRIGDCGFEMTLDRSVPALLEANLGGWVWPWLRGELGNGVTAEDVRWAVHPGGPRVLDAVVQGLGLAMGEVEVSREVLSEHGNMSSATVLFVLRRMWPVAGDDGRPVVMLAFGPGLSGEAALLRPAD